MKLHPGDDKTDVAVTPSQEDYNEDNNDTLTTDLNIPNHGSTCRCICLQTQIIRECIIQIEMCISRLRSLFVPSSQVNVHPSCSPSPRW